METISTLTIISFLLLFVFALVIVVFYFRNYEVKRKDCYVDKYHKPCVTLEEMQELQKIFSSSD